MTSIRSTPFFQATKTSVRYTHVHRHTPLKKNARNKLQYLATAMNSSYLIVGDYSRPSHSLRGQRRIHGGVKCGCHPSLEGAGITTTLTVVLDAACVSSTRNRLHTKFNLLHGTVAFSSPNTTYGHNPLLHMADVVVVSFFRQFFQSDVPKGLL